MKMPLWNILPNYYYVILKHELYDGYLIDDRLGVRPIFYATYIY